MRDVAVTEGDKVAAQIKFGFSVNTHGVGDLAKSVKAATDKQVDTLCKKYEAATRFLPTSKKAANATNPSAKPRASNRPARFLAEADSAASPLPLKICTASRNYQASPRSV